MLYVPFDLKGHYRHDQSTVTENYWLIYAAATVI